MRQQRLPWYEWDDGSRPWALALDAWTTDTDSLYLALCDTGWFQSTGEARRAAEGVVAMFAWRGRDVNGDLALCDEGGATDNGAIIDVLGPVTIADVGEWLLD